jgi:hypothetical protein
MSTNENPGKYYEIVVKGQLEPGWSQWFNGMEIKNRENGEATLSGYVVDQAALHGLLNKIRDLGLPLVAVRCLDEAEESKFHWK